MASARILAADVDKPFRVGLAEGAAGAAFGRFLRACADHKPSIRVLLIERPPVELVTMVESGALEAALLLAPPGARELADEVAWTEPLRLVLPVDHPLAGQRSARLTDVAQETWLLPDRVVMPGLATQIEAVLAGHGIDPCESRRSAHFTTMIQVAATGAGVGLAPASLVGDVAGVVALPLSDPDAIVTTYFVTHADEPWPILKQVRALIGSLGAYRGA